LGAQKNVDIKAHGVAGLGGARELFQKWNPAAANNGINALLFERLHHVQQFDQNRSFASGRKVFRDVNVTGHLCSKTQSVFHEKVRLFLAPAPVQGEVNVELYRMYARQSVGQFSRAIENSTGIRVVGIRRRHEEHVSAFTHCFELQVVAQLLR
jgi:hypothetical protein